MFKAAGKKTIFAVIIAAMVLFHGVSAFASTSPDTESGPGASTVMVEEAPIPLNHTPRTTTSGNIKTISAIGALVFAGSALTAPFVRSRRVEG